MNYLLDTCIWRDYFEDRRGFKDENLGGYASKLILKVIKTNSKIFYSDSLIIELSLKYSVDEINKLLDFFFLTGILIKIEITQKEYTEAKFIASQRNLPLVDCLNAV